MDEATGDIDVETLAEVAYYNLKKREGFNLMSARHHFAAMLASKSRIEELKKLELPTLIIHGVKDPVIPIVHGKKLAETIPNSESLWIENMGHDLPDWAIRKLTDAIIRHFRKNVD
ncbi:alpha/beta fold hydrolase [Maribacter halichondriae]|uniref:alpha/beta fold hydrolase n=1 Tax=Maribacter halichondriae TaxID=2980554 RepID=UPI0023590087|nr:alpha/beta hydrolase [Maribacter sp. Hal144]